jgi:hypothetical protein
MAVLRYASTSVLSSLSDEVRICIGPSPWRSAPSEAPVARARGGIGWPTSTALMQLQ